MSRTPINQMSYTPGRGSEAAEFSLRELYEEVTNFYAALRQLENKMTTDDLSEDVAKLKSFACEVTLKLDTLFDEIKFLKDSQHLLESKQINLENAMLALLSKMDLDNVAQNIAVSGSQSDEDYELTIKPIIYNK